jgi:hypothetical protein
LWRSWETRSADVGSLIHESDLTHGRYASDTTSGDQFPSWRGSTKHDARSPFSLSLDVLRSGRTLCSTDKGKTVGYPVLRMGFIYMCVNQLLPLYFNQNVSIKT